MIRNTPHRAEVRRRTKIVQNGEVFFEDTLVGTVQGLFTLLGADEGVELAARAQRAGATGARPDQIAAFRTARGSATRPQAQDYLVLQEPLVDGRWQVVGARWTPGDGTRLILLRS